MILVLHNISWPPAAGRFVGLLVRNQRVSETVRSVNHPVIILFLLLLHVLVSDCEAGLVSMGVAARCVTLLRPHFLFVMAGVYIQSAVTGCRVHTAQLTVFQISDAVCADIHVSYLLFINNMAAA